MVLIDWQCRFCFAKRSEIQEEEEVIQSEHFLCRFKIEIQLHLPLLRYWSSVAYLAKTCKPNFQELDRFTQRFIHIFKAKGGDIGCKLKKILQQIENEKSEIIGRRTAVLHGLPLLLRADPTDFYKTCFDCDDKGEMSGISIGILFVIPEDSATVPYCLHLDATFTAIILEGRVVMDDLGNLPKAMCLLFWLIYALNVEYPAVLKNMFDFFQSVIVTRGKSLKPEKSPVAVTLLCHD
ncbi:uncharacterized protein LOC113058214 isoform X1 [Carassius auratus]|uniref:Uncharacterized protein LOC113058214 isoform X1 n=1 Tax=Carassius auratus TaxID=7957 RepID=A0A6P6LAP4_CARAU|nr:uncharacterized protein LOC113058214 isoform X1 [Carassius auratus]